MNRNMFLIERPRTVVEQEERDKWALAAKIAEDIASQNRWNATAEKLRAEERERRASMLKQTGDW